MSWSEEFGKLHKHYKMCLAFIALLMPFWYVFIYLFAKPVYAESNLYFISCVCFCLAITWFICCVLIGATISIFSNQFSKTKRNTLPIEQTLMFGGIGGILYISGLIYLLRTKQNVELLKFTELLYIGYTGILEGIIPLTILIILVRVATFAYQLARISNPCS